MAIYAVAKLNVFAKKEDNIEFTAKYKSESVDNEK